MGKYASAAECDSIGASKAVFEKKASKAVFFEK
jgi:hypothetical protein